MKGLQTVLKVMIMEKKDMVYSIIFGFVAGIAAVGLFAASGYLISKSALVPPLYTLIILTSTVKLLGFIRALSRYAERYFSHRATFTMLSNLRVSFFKKLEVLAPGIFNRYRSGDLLARIVGDVESLQNFFLRVVYPPIVLTMVFLSTILFTMYFSIIIALVLLVGLLLTTVVVPALFSIRQAKVDHRVREGRGHLSTEVTELFHGYRDLKIYQRLEEKEDMLLQSSDHYRKEQEHEGIHQLYSQSVNIFVSLFISWAVLLIGALLVTEGKMEGIFLTMLVLIALTVFEDVGPMAVFPNYMQDSKLAATRLFSIVQENQEEKGPELMERLTPDKAPSMELDNVTFTFPGEWRAALQQVHLTIASGSKTAIVGPSGSGKSALLQLLLKMSIADEGDIRFDDTPVSQIKEESIWQEAKVVLQENHFFYGSLRDNLRLAGDAITDEQMMDALKSVQLDHFDLDNDVYEKAENFSGGEQQRLAIARAMLKGGHLWILDEPTSSVDAVTTEAIYKQLLKQANKDTLVLVSHRLAGLERMDQIIVMEQGTVVEAGTYEELMQREGYFYEMKQIEKYVL